MYSWNHIFRPSLKYEPPYFTLTFILSYFQIIFMGNSYVTNSYTSFTLDISKHVRYRIFELLIKSFLISFQIIFLQIYTSEGSE